VTDFSTDFSMDTWIEGYIQSIGELSDDELSPLRKGWFKTPQDCKNREIALKAEGNLRLVRVYSDLRYRLSVASFMPRTLFEAECIVRLIACEEIRRDVLGKSSPLNRLRQSGRRNGWAEMISRTVLKKSSVPSTGFEMMLKAGRLDLSFEAFVVENPERFSMEAVTCCRKRLGEHGYPFK